MPGIYDVARDAHTTNRGPARIWPGSVPHCSPFGDGTRLVRLQGELFAPYQRSFTVCQCMLAGIRRHLRVRTNLAPLTWARSRQVQVLRLLHGACHRTALRLSAYQFVVSACVCRLPLLRLAGSSPSFCIPVTWGSLCFVILFARADGNGSGSNPSGLRSIFPNLSSS